MESNFTTPVMSADHAHESPEDRIVMATAMLGAVAGAIAGAGLGASGDNFFPVLCGTLGTLLGSSLFAAFGVYVVEPLWLVVYARRTHTPVESAK